MNIPSDVPRHEAPPERGDDDEGLSARAPGTQVADGADVSDAHGRAAAGPQPATDETSGLAGPQVQEPYEGDGRDLLAVRRRPPAGRGWRKLVAKLTAGRVNPAPSAKQNKDAELTDAIRAGLAGVHKVAFVSAKGGVGKSTMTVSVGNAIARLRGDRVIAVDADADLGDLSARFSERGGPQANVEQLAAAPGVERYSNVRMHTVVNADRLEMLAAQNDPRSTYRFGPDDYAATMKILEVHCNVILLDCGTPINDPLFARIADDVTGLVVVASQDVRGVEGALATLDWLHAHGHDQLLDRTVIALNASQRGKPLIDRNAVENQFKKRVRGVFAVPYDPHLAAGVAVDFTALKRKTRRAVLALAAGLAEHYPCERGGRHREDELGAWIELIRRDPGANT